MINQKTLLVVGGGAAGFFCAINAARMSPSLKVIIVEKTNKLLSKVKVSGGGRCNVTHASNEVGDLLGAYPRGKNFMRKTLHQFSPKDTIDWFAQRGVVLKTESDGRLFPTTNNSQTIIDCFLKEAAKYNVDIQLQTTVTTISKLENGFEVMLQKNKPTLIHADYLCLATGGFSKIESFEFISKLGMNIVPPVPSLFTFNIDDKLLHQLMGVSVELASVKIPRLKMEQEGPLLITHWGLSGPAVLKLSSYAAIELHQLNYDVEVLVN
ncbi:MAG: aminoacetone oxidase family FAD-binding enzyme, partial [Chitinophagia bacterium]|nr:aminoacetone oxidase family FAD-binding enzyme [Chitinophagia bacterium]